MDGGDIEVDARQRALAQRLALVRGRIAGACDAAGRPQDAVQLVVVTKHFPAKDVARLARCQVVAVGENRAQEAHGKVAALAGDAQCAGLRWHFVGQLQTNKAASVARWADTVHSVDRARVAVAVGRGARLAGRRVQVLVQVNVDVSDSRGRGGCLPAEAVDVMAVVAEQPFLVPGGVMAVAPQGASADEAFAQLAQVSAQVRQAFPCATEISAGMSGDFEAAIRHGATLVRIGAAVLGTRPFLG